MYTRFNLRKKKKIDAKSSHHKKTGRQQSHLHEMRNIFSQPRIVSKTSVRFTLSLFVLLSQIPLRFCLFFFSKGTELDEEVRRCNSSSNTSHHQCFSPGSTSSPEMLPLLPTCDFLQHLTHHTLQERYPENCTQQFPSGLMKVYCIVNKFHMDAAKQFKNRGWSYSSCIVCVLNNPSLFACSIRKVFHKPVFLTWKS